MSGWLGNYKGDPSIKAALEAGRPLMLAARNSSHGGRKGRELAAQELHSAAEALRDTVGIDVVADLPSQSELMDMLKKAKTVKSTGVDGRDFTHEYVHHQIAGGRVHILIATGSARKLTTDFEQPFMSELVDTIKVVHPALVYCHVLDRLIRHALSAALLLIPLTELDIAIGDRKYLPFKAGGVNDLLTIMRGMGSQQEVEKLPESTRRGMEKRTQTKLENGQCWYAFAPTPPPGLARMRLLTENDGIGQCILVLDDPACYPPEDRVAVGRPHVHKEGKPVNQIELIRHVLTRLGEPGHTRASLGRYLARNHFSTDGLRKTHGSRAHFGMIDLGGSDYRPTRAILENLDVYETGEWIVNINAGGLESIAIQGIMPADGKPWASPEDFARIREYLSRERKGGGRPQLALTGVQVTVDGNPGTLHLADKKRNESRTCYGVGGPRGIPRRFNFPALPHKVLADSIIDGLADAADRIWIPVDLDGVDPQLLQQRQREQEVVARLERIVNGISDQITEADTDGRPLLTSSTRAELSRRQEAIIRDELEPARNALHDLEAAIAEASREASQQRSGTPISLLHLLIERLADPEDVEYNDWWKRSLEIHFTRKPLQKSGHDGVALDWTGTLKITQGSELFEVPFAGSFAVGSASKVDERIEAILHELRNGIPFRASSTPRARELRDDIARRLGMTSASFLVGNILDPRILRIGVRIIENPEESDASLARRFQESEQFISRVRHVVTVRPSGYRWLRNRQAILQSTLPLAHADEGFIRKASASQACGGTAWGEIKRAFRLRLPESDRLETIDENTLRIPPCPHCQSRRRSISRLNEPVGFVCLNCHLDHSGVLWPEQPYDQWLETA